MKDTLTKENFWNEMEQKYPKAMTHFKEWLYQYQIEYEWDALFTFVIKENPTHLATHRVPRYNELPIAMQFGIFYAYAAHCRSNLDLMIEGGTVCEEKNILIGTKFFIGMTLMTVNGLLGGKP